MAFRIQTVVRAVAVFPLFLYKRFLSPLLPKACLYTPSCSEYAMGAIKRHGVVKGLALGLARLWRCNGWFFSGGDDPVPDNFSWKEMRRGYREFRKKR